jgi:general secretion pathway protein A
LYLQYFGLNEAPFAITPDPAFIYLSAEHREALAHLLFAVGQGGSGGFVQLTGEVGTGKTTLCRAMLEQLPENAHVALVLNPLMTPRELLATICEELGIDTRGIADSSKSLVDSLNRYLLQQHARGHRVVVVIDEAQNLSPEALEQVRLLTNLETAKEKLLQMVLLGQPELRQLLQRRDLRQLAQRITARYHLAPLGREETFEYVRHRIKVAGGQRNPFRRSALAALYRRSGGVPRLINIIADRALAGAYARETEKVGSALVNAAADEVQPSEERVRRYQWPAWLATAAAVLLAVVSVTLWKPGFLMDSRDMAMSAKRPASEVLAPGAIPVTVVEADDPEHNPDASRDADAPPEAGSGLTVSDDGDMAADSVPADPDVLNPDWLLEQHELSWRTLAELWSDSGGASAIRTACEGSGGSGYACLRDYGNWSRIRQLGLPVILVLRGTEERLLVLRGFRGETLMLGAPRSGRTAGRNEIEQRWLGEYFVAWPQAPGWPPEIHPGETGPAVEIVTEMAAHAEPAWQGGQRFDENFESWLRSYQRDRGLEPDGIIGPQTLIHLMAPTITEPRLVLEP